MVDPHSLLATFNLTPQQYAAAAERARDVVVTAGAGSGKTRTLVARYISLLAEGLSPRRVTAITFTEKAAREMRSRVRSSLTQQIASSQTGEERRWWGEIEAQMDSARIGTIHSLCAEILRTHPAEASVDPRFEVLDEGLSATLRAQVVDDTLAWVVGAVEFSPLLAGMSTNALQRLLGYLLDHRLEAQAAFEDASDPQSIVLQALQAAVSHPSVAGPLASLRGLQAAGGLAMDAGPNLAGQIEQMLAFWDQADQAVAAVDGTTAARQLFLARRKMGGNAGVKTSLAKAWLSELKGAYDLHLAPWLGGKTASDSPPDAVVENLFVHVVPLVRLAFDQMLHTYQSVLRQRQALDFDDLESGAARLLDQPALQRKWQGEVDALLVDEFQDTNDRQRAIVLALSGETPGRLFVVGDARQSIYRFRRADVTVFRRLMEQIQQAGGLVIDLAQTYRAHTLLLQVAGDLLEAVMGSQPDPDRPYYVPFSPLHSDHDSPREGIQPPHVEFLLGGGADAESARPAAAYALAQRLRELYQAGQILRWDDVALLFRASTGFPPYEDAFEDAGIPFVTVAGQGFYNRPEIRDVLNLLTALADPWNDLAMAGLLRSPAFGLSDAALYLLRHQAGQKLPYWSALQSDLAFLPGPDQAYARHAFEILSELNPLVDRLPVAELLKRLVDRVDYRAILASADADASPPGAAGRLWRNLDKLLADAHNSGLVNVRAFLEYLATLRDVGAREGEAPAEAEGAVRLMTIHKAKGLEFPLVVLADAARQRRNITEAAYLLPERGLAFKFDQFESQPLAYRLASFLDSQQSEAEEKRLIYVALTRAKEKLLISGHVKVAQAKADGWLGDLLEAGRVDLPAALDSGQPFEAATVGGYPSRVWALTPESTGRQPVQQESVADWPDSAGEPLYHPLLLPEPETGDPDPADMPRRWRAAGGSLHPPAEAIGRLVHHAIQRWLFPGSPVLASVLETAALEAGLADPAQRAEALHQAEVLLARLQSHPLWDEIDQAEERYHEVPYSHLGTGHRLDTGYLDLLYRSADGWQILDFKTDSLRSAVERGAAVEMHSSQMRRYAHAGLRLLRQPVRVRLCFLDDERRISLIEIV